MSNVHSPTGDTCTQKVNIGPREVKIPKEWKVVRLGDDKYTELVTQGPNPDYDKGEPRASYRAIKTKDLYDDGVLYENADEIPKETFNNREKYALQDRDLLVAIVGKGSIGKTHIFREQEDASYIFTRAIGVIRVNQEEILPEYLHHYLQSHDAKQHFYQSITGSTGQEVLRISAVRAMPIPLPPLPEQHRIANGLSTVDERILEQRDAVQKYKELKRGLMQDLLVRGIGHEEYVEQYLGPRKLEVPAEWRKARLSDVTEIITRGKQPTYVEEGGAPVLNQSCIYWDGFHPEALKRLDSEVASGWKDKYWVKNGDVLINSTGKGTLGRALEWTKESDTYALDSHVTRVHPDESVLDPTYLRFYLESNHGQKMLYAFCVAGSTGQIELSKTDLQTMPILLPPIDEQREISEAFHRVNKMMGVAQDEKNDLQELKQGLMQDLLTGNRRLEVDT